MRTVKQKLLCVLFFLFLWNDCFAAKNGNAEVVSKIVSISNRANSVIGVTAIHIESNSRISYNGNQPFFMASTVKLPIAIALLHKVDEGQASLDNMVKLTSNNAVPGGGKLHLMLDRKPMRMSLRQLLWLMLIISDNSASDAILREVHGPYAVMNKLKEFGFHHILVKRSLLKTFVDSNGASQSILNQRHTSRLLTKKFNRIPILQKITAWQQFEKDMRDTTTTDDMARLLVGLYNQRLLSPSSTDLLMNVMEQCETGKNRIKGLLPSDVKVAHKTGTWTLSSKLARHPLSKRFYGYTSDVGIITLPGNNGHIAIAVYVKSRGKSDRERSRAIALVSKVIYNHFYVNKTMDWATFQFRSHLR